MQEFPFAELEIAPVQVRFGGKLRVYFLDMWNLNHLLGIQMEMLGSQ